MWGKHILMKRQTGRFINSVLSVLMALGTVSSNSSIIAETSSPTPDASETKSVSGIVVVMDSGETDSYKPEIHVYADDVDATAMLDSTDQKYLGGFSESTYTADDLKKTDSQQTEIQYSVQDTAYTDEAAYKLYVVDPTTNLIVSPDQTTGRYPAGSTFIYVRKTAIEGTAWIEGGMADTSGIQLLAEPSNDTDKDYAGDQTSSLILNDGENGTWSVKNLLAFNPLTGGAISYAATVQSGLENYQVIYDNTAVAGHETAADELHAGGVLKASKLVSESESDESKTADTVPQLSLSMMAAPSIKKPLINISYTGDAPASAFTYQISNSDKSLYTGTYEIYNADGTKKADGTIGSDGRVSVQPTETGWQIELTGAADSAVLTVLAVANGGKSLLSKSTQESTGGAAAAAFAYGNAAADVVLTKDWNDNDNESKLRPAEDDFSSHFHLTFSTDNGTTYTVLTTNNMNQIGLNEMPAATVDTTSSYNAWTYTYKGLPASANGKNIVYGAQEDTGFSNANQYIADNNTGNSQTISNVLKTTFKATKIWYDNNNQYGTRPTISNWIKHFSDDTTQNYINVYRYLLGGSPNPATDEKITNTGEIAVTGSDTDMQWSLSLSGLPKYDANGIPYVYYLIENEAKLNSGLSTGDSYATQYVNAGDFASDTARLEEGGTLSNILNNTTAVQVNKIWLDGGNANRPTAKLYLYRYADGTGSGYDSASPVEGYDSTDVPTAGENGSVININISNSLPKYDATGHKYIYFLKERFTGGSYGDYQQIISNPNGSTSPSGVLDNGGTITNKLSATENINATKIFQAAAMQGATGISVTFALQRRLTGETAWTNVTTLTINDFSAEALTKTKAFENQPKYDENGFAYEYRYVETSVSMNGVTATIDPDTAAEFKLPAAGPDGTTARYQIIQNADGSTTNRLVGETQVVITKNWSTTENGETSTAAPADASVTLQIIRSDGKTSYAATPAESDNFQDSKGSYVKDITLDATTGWTVKVPNLVRYDDNGAEYTYSIKETNATPSGYATDYTYTESLVDDGSGNIIKQLNAAVSNTKGPGTTLTFDVNKVWLDDSDLLHRNPGYCCCL
jgi:hypothetical protein